MLNYGQKYANGKVLKNLKLNLLLIASEKLDRPDQNHVGQDWCENGCKCKYTVFPIKKCFWQVQYPHQC